MKTAVDVLVACSALRDALRETPECKRLHHEAFWQLRDLADDGAAAEASLIPVLPGILEMLFEHDWVSHDDLFSLAVDALHRRHPGWTDPAAVQDRVLAQLLSSDRLFLGMLRWTVNADPGVESVLRRLRRFLLLELSAVGPAATAWVPLLAAIAQQSFNNEFIWVEDADESVRVAALCDQWRPEELAADAEQCVTDVLRVGMYRPLMSVPQAHALVALPAGSLAPPVRDVVTRLIREPLEERALDSTTPAIGSVGVTVPGAVRGQYEANPFPRWFALRPPRPGHAVTPPWSRSVGTLPPVVHPDAATVLVPGCGTGRHALSIAAAFPTYRVVASDVSRASLAYARRMAQKLDIRNVEFLHCDLRDVAQVGQRFHHIDCVGVLHHLEDPVEGWVALDGVLEPGGTCRLGVYSRVARLHLDVVTREIAQRRIPATAAGMRAFREEVIAQPRFRGLVKVLGVRDFFYMSGLRDFLFHACEHRFSIDELGEMIARFNYDFLGFDLPPALKRRYCALFPGDPGLESPSQWRAFESQYAGSTTMLMCVVQKLDARGAG
jgi:SAM-dependent methyltransferase